MNALGVLSMAMLILAIVWWLTRQAFLRGMARGIKIGISHGRELERHDSKAAKRKIVASAGAVATRAWLDAAYGGRR